MASGQATSSPPSLLNRSRSYSDEENEEDESYDTELRQTRRRIHRSSRHTSVTGCSGASQAIFVPHWSLEDGGWGGMKAVDEIALLESIEEQAATYSPSTPINHTTTTTTITNTTELYPSVLLSNPSPPINFQLGSSSPHTVSPTSVPSPSSSVATLPANEKPYKCPICPKSFTRNYDLTRHKSSHQDARIHVCRHCGRSFNRRDALSRHNIVRGCGQNGRVGTRHLQKTPS